MAGKKDELTAFEQEVVNYYMEDYLRTVEDSTDNSIDELEKIVMGFKYGEGYRMRGAGVNWGNVFNKHSCPVCGDLISLREKQYVCGKCGLSLPLELYDKAERRYQKEAEEAQKSREFSKRMVENGLSEKRMEELYDMGVDKALRRMEEAKKPK